MTAVTGPPSTCGTASPDDLRELSQVQRDQWILHTLSPEGSAYNTGVAVRIRSALDLAALKRAVRSVGERHEMFRSTFTEQAGRAVRRLLPLSTVTLTVRDCAGLSALELDDAIAAELRAPFRLSEQPPFRIALFVSAADNAVLLVTGHHIATDA